MTEKKRRSSGQRSPSSTDLTGKKKRTKDSQGTPDQQVTLERKRWGPEESKFELGPTVEEPTPLPENLPAEYGEDRIVLMVRDPYWVYTYWEVTPQRIEQGRAHLGRAGDEAKFILRVYDVTGVDFDGTNAHSSFDVEITDASNNWYVHVKKPCRTYCVDIGLLAAQGEFFSLARSNHVTTPRDGMSEALDERWMSPQADYERMYALSGGFRAGADSLGLRELMEKRLQMELASGALGSLELASGALRRKERGFWFLVDAELVIYGATEPNAQVTLQGKPVLLREDGTFTVRFALPDGEQVIPVTAKSADGKEERTITPCVARRTEVPEPTIRGE